MRRHPPLSRLLRIAAPGLPCALALAAFAQELPPQDVGSDVLGIAREALSAGTADPNEAEAVDGPEFATIPHPDGSGEVVPILPGVTVAAGDAVPSAQGAGDGEKVAQPLPADRDPGLPEGQDGAAPAPQIANATPAGAEDPGTVDAGAATTQVVTAATAPASADGTPDTPESKDAAGTKGRDPVEMLKGLWREAVASGKTSEGFETWLSAALNPPPEDPSVPESHAARTREVAAVWNQRTGPVALGEAGRVVTTFGEAIPVAYCSPLTVCYIELEPGEQLTDSPSIGDSVRWQVAVKLQGWDPETVLLEIKPSEDAVQTNLVVPTDRRIYTITLVNDRYVHTPILAFRWPDSEAREIAESIARRRAEELALEEASAAEAASRSEITAAEMALSGVPTESGPRAAELLDFRFRWDGDAPFRPTRVFADESRTYIDLPLSYRGPLPVIVAGKGEGNAALNTRVSASGSRLVADRVITDVWLQSGKKRVRIRRITH